MNKKEILKLYKKIVNIDEKRYKRWIKKYKIESEKDLFLMFSGMRLLDKYYNIKYPDPLPLMSKEEYEYYKNLKQTK